MRTLSRVHCSHNRVIPITLDDLTDTDNGIGDLYDKMVDLNIAQMNIYKPGSRRKPLHLLTENEDGLSQDNLEPHHEDHQQRDDRSPGSLEVETRPEIRESSSRYNLRPQDKQIK